MVVCTILFMLKAKFISIPAEQKLELMQQKDQSDNTIANNEQGIYFSINENSLTLNSFIY